MVYPVTRFILFLIRVLVTIVIPQLYMSVACSGHSCP